MTVNPFTALIRSFQRRLNGMPKFYDRELERRVREQLQIVTDRLSHAVGETRRTRTGIQVPDLSGQIGFAGLTFELTSEPVDGIVKATYTGPQAKYYLDILNRGVGDICTVFTAKVTGKKNEEPTIAAELRLPVKFIG